MIKAYYDGKFDSLSKIDTHIIFFNATFHIIELLNNSIFSNKIIKDFQLYIVS